MKPLKSAGEFKQVPAGPQPAVLFQLVDLGTRTPTYQGQAKKPRREIFMGFEVHGDDCRTEDGRPLSIRKYFTLSAHTKSNLRAFMEQWRGKAFNDEEFEAFDLRDMLGKPCILTIVEGENRNEIDGISRLMSGMTAPKQVNANIYFSLDEYDEGVFNELPDKLRETIAQSPEWKRLKGMLPPEEKAADGGAPFDDEIPF